MKTCNTPTELAQHIALELRVTDEPKLTYDDWTVIKDALRALSQPPAADGMGEKIDHRRLHRDLVEIMAILAFTLQTPPPKKFATASECNAYHDALKDNAFRRYTSEPIFHATVQMCVARLHQVIDSAAQPDESKGG